MTARRQPDPRVLYCNRTGAAVSNDAIWSRDPADRRRWLINTLDVKLQRQAAVPAVCDDFGSLVEVRPIFRGLQAGMALPGLTAWLAGITLALLIGCAHYLDDIPDHSAEWDQAVYLQDAINAAIDQRKFDRAAQALCGPQAAWQQLQDGSVQCKTKHGRPTITVQVAP